MTTYADLVHDLVMCRILDRVESSTALPSADLAWLTDLHAALDARQPADLPAEEADAWWTVRALEAADGSPLARVGLDAALVLVAAGLVEADIRFGSLFATLQDPLRARRPCIGLLGWLLGDRDGVARTCHDLVRRGLLSVDNPTEPRGEWTLRLPIPVWELLVTGRIEPASLPGPLTLRTGFPDVDDLAVPPALAPQVARLPALLAEGAAGVVLVRGLRGAGRSTVLGAAAARLGLAVLQYAGDPADPAWRLFAALSSLAPFLPVVRCEPGPGETVTLPGLPGYDGPLGVVTGRSGSVTGPQCGRTLVLDLTGVDPDDRRLLWRAGGVDADTPDLDEIVDRFLLTPGDIVRAAPAALLAARADGRDRVTCDDVREATRTLGRQELETLATRLDPLPTVAAPVLPTHAAAELDTLARRCRHRERLVAATSPGQAGVNRGVRALFSGPSGTGKTLAARHLAAVLHLDVFRVDLAAVVNKYIGETERNLDKVLTRAEELDVLLLLDEGDALMTRRTDVSNSNDRYANLETNFLLQRLETFEGIVVVTSNAAGRIDPAFLRRIDVTVDFVPPDAEQRLRIWYSHLPVEHDVDPVQLAEVARRCGLTGGQIRNAALHATLLAVDRGASVSTGDLHEAVRREYRRAGATCPMTERNGHTLVPGW